MALVEELQFAQRYPFSGQAQRIRTQSDVVLGELPDELVERARAIVAVLASNRPYMPAEHEHSEVLLTEVMAFPLVKLILSAIGREELYTKFATGISDSAFRCLQTEPQDVLEKLAADLGIGFEPCSQHNFVAMVPLSNYLKFPFRQDFMKLIHQPVEGGYVYLTKQAFIRMLAMAGLLSVMGSLPIPKQKIPGNIQEIARELGAQMAAKSERFAAMPVAGLRPGAFPPCIAELYSSLASGRSISHTERFALATFLLAAGMPKAAILTLFKNAPNFKRHITEYQLSRLASGASGAAGASGAGGRYSPFSCAKMRSNKICSAECNVKHPMLYYRGRLRSAVRQERSPAQRKHGRAQ